MKILKKEIETKILNPHNTEAMLNLNFNNDFMQNTENDLKIKECNLKIAFDKKNMHKIFLINSELLETHQYNETESFILSLCILLIANLINIDEFIILKKMTID